MSRIGKQPVAIPAGVKVNIDKGTIKVEGPKGKLQFTHHPLIKVASDGKQITVERPDDTPEEGDTNAFKPRNVEVDFHGQKRLARLMQIIGGSPRR